MSDLASFKAKLRNPANLLPRNWGDPEAVITAQITLQNALWMALLSAWPSDAFWSAFWPTVFPQWPGVETWQAPRFLHFSFGIRWPPGIIMIAGRNLQGNTRPHPAAVHLYVPDTRWDWLAQHYPGPSSQLSETGTAWSWFNGDIEIDPREQYAPPQGNELLWPFAHAVAALQPPEEARHLFEAHWEAVLVRLGASPPRSGNAPRMNVTPRVMLNNAAGADGSASGPSRRRARRPNPSVTIRVAPDESSPPDASAPTRDTAPPGGLGGPGSSERIASALRAPRDNTGLPADNQLLDADLVWGELRAAHELATRRDEELIDELRDQVMALRGAVDCHFAAQCDVPHLQAAQRNWLRAEAVNWAQEVARLHDTGDSIQPQLRLPADKTLRELTTEDRHTVRAAVQRAYELVRYALSERETRLRRGLDSLPIDCIALHKAQTGLADHPWLPNLINGSRRCRRCGTEEKVAEEPYSATPAQESLPNSANDFPDRENPRSHPETDSRWLGSDDDDWLR